MHPLAQLLHARVSSTAIWANRHSFFLPFRSITDIFSLNFRSQRSLHFVNRCVRSPPQGILKNRFTTVKTARTTSRTSIPRGLTGERPPVAKTVTSVGTARIITSTSQNLCQSRFLRYIRSHQCLLRGEEGEIRTFWGNVQASSGNRFQRLSSD